MSARSWGDSLTCPPGDVCASRMGADGETEEEGEERKVREEEREKDKEDQEEGQEEQAGGAGRRTE